jgi:hypothetical protein
MSDAEQPYEIDVLMNRLRRAWSEINVSAQTYANALREAGHVPAIHHNTLRRLEDPNWSPSLLVLRDLEQHLLRHPLSTANLPKRVPRKRKRATVCRSPESASAAL